MELLTIRPLWDENIISSNIKLLLYYIFILYFPFEIKAESSNVTDNHYHIILLKYPVIVWYIILLL